MFSSNIIKNNYKTKLTKVNNKFFLLSQWMRLKLCLVWIKVIIKIIINIRFRLKICSINYSMF